MSPTRVDFYLLSDTADQAPWLVACRLLEKAYQANHSVYVFCNNQQETEYLDELLWTFKEDSFIPHNIQGEGPEPPPSIQLGYKPALASFKDILLNMTPHVPEFYPQFRRVIEVVSAHETQKQQKRDSFRVYHQAGCEMYTLRT